MATVVVFAGVGWWLSGANRSVAVTAQMPGEGGSRLMVEVLNGTTIDGLARGVTRRLRRQGIDVVYYGSATISDAESTFVIARGGDTTAAREVRDALGVGTVLNDPLAYLLLDVTVVLGRDADPRSLSTRN